MTFLSLHTNIKLRVIIIFLNNLTTNMIFPFMSIYFAKHLGLKPTSLVLTIAIVLTLLGNLYGGGYADKHGRKFIMALSEGVKLLIFVGFLIGTSTMFYWPLLTVICFLLRSFCNGLYGPAADAMLLDVTTADERKYMYSIMYWINNLSLAIGTGIGAYFFDISLSILFAILVCTSLISFIITITFIKETYIPDSTSSKPNKNVFKNYFGSYGTVFKDRVFIIYVTSGMLLFSLEANLTRYLSIKLEGYDFLIFNQEVTGTKLFGILLIENTILVVLLSIFLSNMIKQFKKEKTLFIGGLIFYVAGYGILGTSLNPWILLLLMVVTTLGEVIFAPIYQSYLGDLTDKSLRSSYMAVSKFANRGSMLIATSVIYLVSISSPVLFSILNWVTGILGLVIMCILLPSVYSRREHLNSVKKAV